MLVVLFLVKEKLNMLTGMLWCDEADMYRSLFFEFFHFYIGKETPIITNWFFTERVFVLLKLNEGYGIQPVLKKGERSVFL